MSEFAIWLMVLRAEVKRNRQKRHIKIDRLKQLNGNRAVRTGTNCIHCKQDDDVVHTEMLFMQQNWLLCQLQLFAFESYMHRSKPHISATSSAHTVCHITHVRQFCLAHSRMGRLEKCRSPSKSAPVCNACVL